MGMPLVSKATEGKLIYIILASACVSQRWHEEQAFFDNSQENKQGTNVSTNCLGQSGSLSAF